MYRSQRNRLQRQRNSHSKTLPWPNSSCSWLLAGNYQTSDQLGMFHLHLARRCLSSLSATLLGDAASQQRLIHQGFGPSENEINRNRAKYVKSHFSPGLFHTNVWSCTYCCSTLWVTHQSDCSPSAMRQHHLLLLRSNRLGQVCKPPPPLNAVPRKGPAMWAQNW